MYDELKQLGEGAKDLLHWRILAVVYLNTLVYSLIAGGALYFIIHGIGGDYSGGP